MPSRDRLFFRLSRASGRRSPRDQFAHILGSYIHRWQPDRSRFVLRVLYKRICPLKRFQHRLISLCIIVPSKRHGDRLFWSIEIGTPNPVGKLLKRKNISGTTAIFFDEAESTVVVDVLDRSCLCRHAFPIFIWRCCLASTVQAAAISVAEPPALDRFSEPKAKSK